MEKKEIKVEIKVDDETASGKFSNFSNITQSNEEFIFDYLFINPAPPPGFGKLISRIVMTPGHAKRLYMALKSNIDNYEEQFGEIKVQMEKNLKSTIQ